VCKAGKRKKESPRHAHDPEHRMVSRREPVEVEGNIRGGGTTRHCLSPGSWDVGLGTEAGTPRTSQCNLD